MTGKRQEEGGRGHGGVVVVVVVDAVDTEGKREGYRGEKVERKREI